MDRDLKRSLLALVFGFFLGTLAATFIYLGGQWWELVLIVILAPQEELWFTYYLPWLARRRQLRELGRAER